MPALPAPQGRTLCSRRPNQASRKKTNCIGWSSALVPGLGHPQGRPDAQPVRPRRYSELRARTWSLTGYRAAWRRPSRADALLKTQWTSSRRCWRRARCWSRFRIRGIHRGSKRFSTLQSCFLCAGGWSCCIPSCWAWLVPGGLRLTGSRLHRGCRPIWRRRGSRL